MFEFDRPLPWEVQDQLNRLEEMLGSLKQDRELSRDALLNPRAIEKTARYSLVESAAILDLSQSTLRRRANLGRIAIHRDGRRPFIMGAELLSYMRKVSRK